MSAQRKPTTLVLFCNNCGRPHTVTTTRTEIGILESDYFNCHVCKQPIHFTDELKEDIRKELMT